MMQKLFVNSPGLIDKEGRHLRGLSESLNNWAPAQLLSLKIFSIDLLYPKKEDNEIKNNQDQNENECTSDEIGCMIDNDVDLQY